MKEGKTKLTTTLTLLKGKNACSDGYKTLIHYIGHDYDENKEINLLTILKSNGIDHFFWAFRAISQPAEIATKIKNNIVADIAESVLHLYEKQYKNDDRPRKAIESCRNNHINASDAALAAYAAGNAINAIAAHDANYADYAAAAAVDAFHDAAAYAAYAAAYAADAAAEAAAPYAPYAAAKTAAYAAAAAANAAAASRYAAYAAADADADAAFKAAAEAAAKAKNKEKTKQIAIIHNYLK